MEIQKNADDLLAEIQNNDPASGYPRTQLALQMMAMLGIYDEFAKEGLKLQQGEY